jgi:hypothetical protein
MRSRTVSRAEDRHAVLVRQAEVEHREVADAIGQRQLGCAAVGDPVDREAGVGQSLSDSLAEHGVVFDQQQSHRGRSSVRVPQEMVAVPHLTGPAAAPRASRERWPERALAERVGGDFSLNCGVQAQATLSEELASPYFLTPFWHKFRLSEIFLSG